MLSIESRRFYDPKNHHNGWFSIFRFKAGVEIWFGHRWISITKENKNA